jgi:hypothetical protein
MCRRHPDGGNERITKLKRAHKTARLCRECPLPAVSARTFCQKHLINNAERTVRRKYNYTDADWLRRTLATICDWCHLPFDGETPHQDHSHACCSGRTSCGKCLRGLLHPSCNTHDLARFEKYEAKSGITLPMLKGYRDRFPRRTS